MADPADDKADYREALARAEAQALAEQSGETPAVEGEQPAAVPVQASDQPLVTETATADTPVVEAPAAESQTAVAAPVDLEAEVARLQAQLAEKDSFIGRQSTDVGELRREIEAIKAAQAAPAPEPVAPFVSITQDMIDENPAAATVEALRQGNQTVLDVAYDAWKEEDPASATVWLVTLQAQQREAALQEQIEAQNARIEALAAPQAETSDNETWFAAFRAVEAENPGFTAQAARILDEVAPKYPHITAVLENGDVKARAEVLSALWKMDAASQQDPAAVADQLAEAARVAAAEAEAARGGAAVVQGQSTTQGSVVEKTNEELEIERQLARINGGVSLESGWTGRS